MSLNEQQQLAATTDERTVLCLAGAGAGKTSTLTARSEYLIHKGVHPTSILVLTFTNAAAFEMKERFQRLPGIDLSKGCPEFRTFHGFCYSLIIKDSAIRAKLGYSKIPEVCDDAKFKEIKTRIKLAMGCKLSDDKLDKEVPLSKAEQDEKKLFQKALVKEIRKENLITFDIMCYNVCELFVTNAEEIQKYKQKYTHILVDEFQDTDTKQMDFLNSFPVTTNFWFCADALQNIYGFRGTTNEYVKILSRAPGWQVIKLYKNYRSTKQICNFANKFSKTYAKSEYRIEMEGQREGDNVEVIPGSRSNKQFVVDRDHLSILIDKIKESKEENAILCRSNRECAAVREALKNANIQFSSKSKSSDARNIIESSMSNEYMLEWLTTKLDAKDYSDYIRLSAQVPNPDIRWFLTTYGKREDIRTGAEKVIEIRNIVSTDKSFKDKFTEVAAVLRCKTKCKFDPQISSNKQIMDSLKDQIIEMEDAPVYVGTIHSVKGLEYDTVYVMGVDDKMFQLGSEEMNNLYYVAITRAKNHLVVFRR